MFKRKGFLQHLLSVLLIVVLSSTFIQSLTVIAASQVSSKTIVRSLPPAEIIVRARVWVAAKVTYSQNPAARYRYQNYRTDCSGFVTMAWGLLPTPPNYGLDTNGLALVSDPIQKDQLQAGDILLNLDPEYNPDPKVNDTDWAHVVLFVSWTNNAHTTYDAIEENGDFKDGFGFAVEHALPYPYYQGDYHNIQDYKPMRFDPGKAAKLGIAPTIIPGGQWVSPSPKNGSTVTDVLNLAANAYPTHKGDPAISVLYFTIGSMVVCTILPPKQGMTFACTVNLRQLGFSSGQIQVSFNVVDQEYNVNLAPNGVHTLTYIPTPEPVPAPTQPPTTVPMPPTQSSCPATGTARASVVAPLVLGNHQNIVYVYNEGTEQAPTLGNLRRYDVTTRQKTQIVALANTWISEAQLSPDGQWVLFVSQVSGQAAIQMVRIDGQGLQTLHCAPSTQSIFALSWSPDQKSLAFDEGVNIYNSSSIESPDTYVLDIASGTLQLILVQPARAPNQYGFINYTPSYWLDNSRLYMQQYIRCCADNPFGSLYVLDTTKGTNQQASNLLLITKFSGSLYQSFALSPDRTTLFLTQCSCAFAAGTGPSSVTVQPAGGGGTPKTIYTNPTAAITGVYPITNTSLLLLMENYTNGDENIDTSQNGLWKINTDGTGLTRLTTESTLQNSEHTILNAESPFPWANISRDGTMFAAEIVSRVDYNSPFTSTLIFDSLSGNAPVQNFASAPAPARDFSTFPVTIVGWTTL